MELLVQRLRLKEILFVMLMWGALANPAYAGRTGIVAPFNALGITNKEAEKVQRWVVASLISVPHFKWLSASRLHKILNQPQFQGCLERSQCIGHLVKRLGGDFVVMGDIGSLGDGFVIYLKLVSSNSKEIRSISGVLDPSKPGLRNAGQALAYQLLAPEKYVGILNVKVDVPNAWIYLNGQRLAQSPSGRLEDIAVGTHALRVTHPNYRDFVRFVEVKFKSETAVEASLSAFPINASEMKLLTHPSEGPLQNDELPWYRRWWAVTTFAGVVIAATTTTFAIIFSKPVKRDGEAFVHP